MLNCAHHGLKLAAGHHGIGQLHLLGQHGHVLLLDQVIPAVDLQLRLQVGGRVQVLTILSGASALQEGEREGGRWRERWREKEQDVRKLGRAERQRERGGGEGKEKEGDKDGHKDGGRSGVERSQVGD